MMAFECDNVKYSDNSDRSIRDIGRVVTLYDLLLRFATDKIGIIRGKWILKIEVKVKDTAYLLYYLLRK